MKILSVLVVLPYEMERSFMKYKNICDQGCRTFSKRPVGNLQETGDSTHRAILHNLFNVMRQGKGTGETGPLQTPNCSTSEGMPNVEGRNLGN